MKQIFIFLFLTLNLFAIDSETHPYCKNLESHKALAGVSLASGKCLDSIEFGKSTHKLKTDVSFKELQSYFADWKKYQIEGIREPELVHRIFDSTDVVDFKAEELYKDLQESLKFEAELGNNIIKFELDYSNDEKIYTSIYVTEDKMYLSFAFKNTKKRYVRHMTIEVFSLDIFIDTRPTSDEDFLSGKNVFRHSDDFKRLFK